MSGYDDYDEGSPFASTVRTILGTLVGVLVIAGVLGVIMVFAKSERTETTIVDPGEVGQVRIEATIANITLRPARGDDLEFRASITDGLSKTFYVVGKSTRKADTYVIDADCRRWLAPGCGVDVTIGVPDGFPIEVETTSGSVTINNSKGIVTVKTTTGDVRAKKADLKELSATTVDGIVDVSFLSAPVGFKAHTESGDITATIPKTKLRYLVDVSSEFGEVVNELKSGKNPQGFVTVESTRGNITLRWDD